MGTRRVKTVGYDPDDWGGDDWEDWGPSAPKAKAKAKPKAKTAAVGKASAAPTAAARPAARPAGSEDLAKALMNVLDDRVDKALASCSSSEDAFLRLLTEEIDAGRWEVKGAADAKPAESKEHVPRAKPEEAAEAQPKNKKATKAAAAAKDAPASPVKDAGPKGKPVEEAPSLAEEEQPLEGLVPEGAGAEDARPTVSLVVVGHVDAGKSTLMGHLLFLVGQVSAKEMHKFEKESKQIGKSSFAFAWVLDQGEDERSRGVTIDVCVKHFETKSKRFTILDAPGHADFVPNMLQGAVQADVALLVADVSHFEAGFTRGGQTKEHLQLVRMLGIAQVVVAINKLDTCNWDEKIFEDIKTKLLSFMCGNECGFKEKDIFFVPLSGFTGENMMELKDPELSKWWKGPTLVEAFDQLATPKRQPPEGPLRIPVSDLYKTGSNSCASGKIQSGTLTAGQKVVLMPSGEQTTAKSLQTRNDPVRIGRPGDYMDAILMPVEPQFATIGSVICDLARPIPVVDTFQAQILVLDVDIPLMRGQQLMCYLHSEALTATLVRLEKLVVKGKPQDKKPKCLQKGNVGIVQIRVGHKVPVEAKPKDGSPPTSMSRLVLRDRGRTVAAGMVLAIVTPS